MAESTSSTRRERTARANFIERHRQLVVVVGVYAGALLFSLGLIFIILAIAVSTEPPGTRFASMADRAIVAAAGLTALPIGSYIVYRSFRIAGW